jgi:hypothetical protein
MRRVKVTKEKLYPKQRNRGRVPTIKRKMNMTGKLKITKKLKGDAEKSGKHSIAPSSSWIGETEVKTTK